jgi:hypothetical protein
MRRKRYEAQLMFSAISGSGGRDDETVVPDRPQPGPRATRKEVTVEEFMAEIGQV